MELIRQVVVTCRSRLWLLYWVSTQIRRHPALTRLDNAKSTSRYRPPNGTAGLARSAVSGASRRPAPPASTIPRTRRCTMAHLPVETGQEHALVEVGTPPCGHHLRRIKYERAA